MTDLMAVFGNSIERAYQQRQQDAALLERQKLHEADVASRALSVTMSDKNRMLEDPVKLEKAVANIADFYSPTASTKKSKGEMYGIDSVEASKDSSDPTRGFGTTLRDAFTNDLMDPQLAHVPAGTLLQGRAKQLMETPDGTGRTLTEKSHELARMETSRWFGGIPVKKLPGYDAWHTDKQLQEKQEGDKESWFAHAGEVVKMAGAGAVMGAGSAAATGLAGAGWGGLAGATAGFAMGGPVGALIGGGIGAVEGGLTGVGAGMAAGALTGATIGVGGELLAAPIKKLIHKTEWYQSKIASDDWTEKVKAMSADIAAYLPGGMVAGKGLTASKEGLSALDAVTAKNIVMEEQRGLFSRTKGIVDDPAFGQSKSPLFPGDDIASGSSRSTAQPTPQYSESNEVNRLLNGGKTLAWGLQKEPILPVLSKTKIEPFIDIDSSGGVVTKSLLPETIGDSTLPLLKPVTSSSAPSASSVDRSGRYSLLDRTLREAREVDGVTNALDVTAKAKESILAKPTSSNIIKESSNVKTATKEIEGSTLADTEASLSITGRKEAGTEAIDPTIDTDITALKGSVQDNINNAKGRDVFAEVGKEGIDGKYRSQIAANSEAELASKSSPVKVDDPVVEAFTKIDETVVPTSAQQEKTISNVSKYTEGGKSVIDETFAKSKETSANDLSLFTSPEDAMGGSLESARRPLEIGKDNSGIEKAKQAYLETLGEKGKPITEEEILSDLREMAAGDVKVYDKLVKEQNSEFTTWAKERGFVPDDATKGSPDFVSSGKDRSKYKLIAGMMAFGISAPVLYTSFSGEGQNEVDAGMLDELKKGISKFVKVSAETALKKEGIVKEAFAKGLVSKQVEPGQVVLGSENIQRGIISDSKEIMNLVLANARNKKGDSVQYSIMSPYQILESLFKTGAGKMVNAASNLASFVTAGSRNRENALKIKVNILNAAGIKAVPNQIKKATDHLVPLGARAANFDTTTSLIKQAESRVATYSEKLAKAIKEEDIIGLNSSISVEQQNIGKLKETLSGLEGSVKVFHDEYAKTMQSITSDPIMGPSARVSLALEDPSRTLHPWLPQLSRKEEIAVGQLRGFLDQYRVRAKDRGIATLDNYLPHSPHPEAAKLYQAEMNDVLGGAPYQKFYSRTENSRALLPDIDYTMTHYITDIEPRLQNYDFWEKSGWKNVMNSDLIKNNPGMKKAFDLLYDGSKPQEQTWGNIAARRYSEFEAVHQLFLSPSAGLKHLVKMTADIASAGPSVWLKSFPETAGYMTRSLLNKTFGVNQNTIREGLEKLGIKSDRFGRQLMDDYMDSAIMSGNMRKYMMDMGIESQDQIFNSAKTLWNKTQDIGSTWINIAELADRSISVSSALQMAGKRGMTADQALYGTYDLILKNNFLFGQFNPSWLNNPKIRAFLMFQATPFKIFERRAVVASKALENTKQLSSGMKEMLTSGLDKNSSTALQKMFGSVEGRQKVKDDIFNMRSYMREGQSELKSNLVIDTLRQETDFFGTPIMRQMMTDIMTVGAFTYGGAQAGLALSDHFFHIPFLSTQSKEGHPEIAVSPLTSGVLKGYAAWKSRESEEDFLLNSITKKWLGDYGPLPRTLEKVVKLSTDDIPEIYKRGGGSEHLKYFFGIPGKE